MAFTGITGTLGQALFIINVACLTDLTLSLTPRPLYRRMNGLQRNNNGVNIAYVRATSVRVTFNYVNGAQRFEASARELVNGKYVGNLASNVSLQQHARSVTLYHLQPGREYIIYVQAYGKSGKIGFLQRKVVRTCQQCYVCNDRASNEDCQQQNAMRECPQGMDACLNEIRYSKGVLKISKRCAQWRPELGKRIQNGRDIIGACLEKNVKDAACKCMCRGNLCNGQELPCKGGIWSIWASWSACDVTCGGGTIKRSRTCQGPGKCYGSPAMARRCATNSCFGMWEPWTAWTNCLVTCGGGVKMRRRTCKGPGKCGGSPRETEMCNTQVCRGIWKSWEPWSDCSVPCGGGLKFRMRSCQDSGICIGSPFNEEICNIEGCSQIGSWSKWTEWANCSATCDGSGKESRTRVCQMTATCEKNPELPQCSKVICQGHGQEARTCEKRTACDFWSSWSFWSECGRTCDGGVSERTRRCINGVEGKGNCLGEATDVRTCNSFPCPMWSLWLEWSECSVSCGGGNRTKNRLCVGGNVGDAGCTGSTTTHEICNEQDCEFWTIWSPWRECSASCEGGVTSRTRVCMFGNIGDPGCMGTFREWKGCGDGTCPRWSPWLDWSLCTVSCGGGISVRSRICIGEDLRSFTICSGDDNQITSCNTHSCPSWRSWSNYSPCSTTCGEGIRVRFRVCALGDIFMDGCSGSAKEEEKCYDRECTD